MIDSFRFVYAFLPTTQGGSKNAIYPGFLVCELFVSAGAAHGGRESDSSCGLACRISIIYFVGFSSMRASDLLYNMFFLLLGYQCLIVFGDAGCVSVDIRRLDMLLFVSNESRHF